jgi:hypothetical protein
MPVNDIRVKRGDCFADAVEYKDEITHLALFQYSKSEAF